MKTASRCLTAATRRDAPRPLHRQRGISVVEVMVAMMLFGTVLVAMSGLSLTVARRAQANDLSAKRAAALEQQMNRLQVIPFDSLSTKAGLVTVADGAFPHKRRITLSGTTTRTRVTIEVIPTKAPANAETVAFDRARPTSSPLCRGC